MRTENITEATTPVEVPTPLLTTTEAYNSNPKKQRSKKKTIDHNLIARSCFFLIRHAERVDAEETVYKIDNRKKGASSVTKEDYTRDDPDITNFGLQQAFETGQAIANKINKFKKESAIGKNVKPRILVSPYWRCIKTAKRIIDGMESVKMKIADEQFFVEDAVTEWQNDPNYMLKERKPKLIFDHLKTLSKVKHIGDYEFKKNTLFDYSQSKYHNKNRFENRNSIRLRFIQVLNDLTELSIRDKDSYVYIIVSHATLIEFCSLMCDNVQQKADYCSINIFVNDCYQVAPHLVGKFLVVMYRLL